MSSALLQFLGSAAAILLLAGFAWWLRLGPARTIESDEDARKLAEEVESGFTPVAIARDRHGNGALLRDGRGRVLLLRPHGTHFAGRILGPLASVRVEGEELVVDTAERRFGQHRLTIDEASAWARAIESVKEACHA